MRKPAAPPGAKAALLGLGQKVQEAKAKTLMTTRAFHAGATSPGTKLKSILNHVALERFPFAAYHSQGSEKAPCVCVSRSWSVQPAFDKLDYENKKC